MRPGNENQVSFESRALALADGVDWDKLPSFPTRLFRSRRKDAHRIALPRGPLSLDPADGGALRTAEGSLFCRAKSPTEARCVLYCSYAGMDHVSIPAEPLEVFQAVKRYERELSRAYSAFVHPLHEDVVSSSPFGSPQVAVLSRLAMRRCTSTPDSVSGLCGYLLRGSTTSYKPVFFLSLLHALGTDGRARVDSVTDRFAEFYRQRRRDGLPVERPAARTVAIQSLSTAEIRSLMLSMPCERFRQRDLVALETGGNALALADGIWDDLDMSGFVRCIRLCWQRISEYYSYLAPPQ